MPDGYRTIGELNPMTAPIQMVKKGLLGVGEVPMLSLGTMLGTLAILGTLGLWFFVKSEAAALDSL
jgi:ABC-type polysaccharide/polyol phosphate export permease